MPALIEANFSEDLRVHALAALKQLGAADLPPANQDVRSALVAYFNVRWRLISPRPRQAPHSRELSARLSSDQRALLGAIVREIEAGSDLAPRLSKRVLGKPLYNDKQLNDWGIRHLHVGPIASPHGNELLYVYVKDETIYLIDWQAHGVQSFADQALVQILHDNWPEAIAEEVPPGFVPGTLSPADLSPEDRQRMRGKRGDRPDGTAFTIGTQVADGTIYLPLGGGVMMDGTSNHVVRRVNRERETAANVERWVRENADGLRNQIEEHSGVRLEVLRLQYKISTDPSVFLVYERQANLTLRLPAADAP